MQWCDRRDRTVVDHDFVHDQSLVRQVIVEAHRRDVFDGEEMLLVDCQRNESDRKSTRLNSSHRT